MPRTRPFVRSLLALLLIAACTVALVLPLLGPARAARPSFVSSAPGNLVISSFRFNGPNGENDEYIELFNRNCTTAIDLQNYTFKASSGATFFPLVLTFNGSSQIAPGHYYLVRAEAYSTTTPAPNYDASYTVNLANGTPVPSGIASNNGGVTILDSGGAYVDQVGFASDGYYEGTPLGTSGQSYVRKISIGGTDVGGYVDTNNNDRDFQPQALTTTPHQSADAGTCGIPTQTISGTTGVGAVVLAYRDINNQPQIAISDNSGNYSITIPSNWTGTITPSLQSYSFSPAIRSYTTGVLTDLANQNFAASHATPAIRDVIINEIAWAGTYASDSDQWIELYNTLPYAIDIGGWTLSDSEQAVGTVSGNRGVLTFSKANSPDGKTEPIIPAHGFFIIAKNKNVFQNLTPDYIDPNLSLPSCSPMTYCGDTLYLSLPSPYTGILGAQIDTANYYSYHWLAGSENGHRSMERGGPSGPVPDSYTAWLTYMGSPAPPNCPAHPNVRDRGGSKINGTPGCPNWASIVTPTPIPTSTPYRYKTATPYPPTPYGHMVINEFLPRAGYDWNQDGVVDVYDEFVELKNLGPVTAQLNGWKIDVISPGGPTSYPLSGTLQPDQRVLFYSSKTKLSLWDSGGTVRLINNRGVIIDARSYGAVQSPDQSICRIPDGYYWRFPCFPTPGLENSLTGTLPVPPPIIASKPPPCLLADTVPDPFKLAECYGYGEDVFNPAYWDSQAGFNGFPVPDMYDKNGSVVK